MTDDFFAALSRAANHLSSMKGPFFITAHYDSDGICSAALLMRYFESRGEDTGLLFMSSLSEEAISSIGRDHPGYGSYIFADIGAGYADRISKLGNTLIIDHHDDKGAKHDFLINAAHYEIGDEISCSGMCYLILKKVDPKIRKLAHIAVIGAIGDYLLTREIGKINSMIIQDAETEGLLSVGRGVRMLDGKPMQKALTESMDPYIPGVSGSSRKVKRFLSSAIKNNGDSASYASLSREDQKRLIRAIIDRRKDEAEPEDIFTNKFKLHHSGIEDAYEFSTVLNACGRMGKGRLGVELCLGTKGSLEKAKEVLRGYRNEIRKAIERFRSRVYEISEGKRYLVIDGHSKLMPEIAGVLASIVARSFGLDRGTVVAVLADAQETADRNAAEEGRQNSQEREAKRPAKLSLRVAGESDLDLREILSGISSFASGGHRNAAGAIIDRDSDAFKNLKRRLEAL